jgi:hypothetical protein
LTSCNSPLSSIPEPVPIAKIKSVTVTISNITQDYYSSINWYGLVLFNFEIKNTGNCYINYYVITFEATCSDGSKYTELMNGLDVRVDEIGNGIAYVNTYWKKYISIKVKSIELISY